MPIQVVLGNEYGSQPSDKIVAFCGQAVIKELMEKSFTRTGRPDGNPTKHVRVNFSKDGKQYYVLKGSPDVFGEFLFHVYEYI